MNTITINGQTITFNDFIELRSRINMKEESPDSLSETIRGIISWDSKYRGHVRRIGQPRVSDINLRKYHFVLHLKSLGLTDKEAADKMNSIRLRTATRKLWNKSMVKKIRHKYAGMEAPEDFDPIEFERISIEYSEKATQKGIEKMISRIKDKISFD